MVDVLRLVGQLLLSCTILFCVFACLLNGVPMFMASPLLGGGMCIMGILILLLFVVFLLDL